jgi:YgiT-type zinc finger domain-containing protein
MKCAVCRNEMVEKKGEIELRIKGKLYLVTNVSYEECQFCGEKVIPPRIEQNLTQKDSEEGIC